MTSTLNRAGGWKEGQQERKRREGAKDLEELERVREQGGQEGAWLKWQVIQK